MTTIALPKGRLFEKTQGLLARCGYQLSLGERELVASDAEGRMRAVLVKNSDLPTYVHHGIAGLGICGSDVIVESGFEFIELLVMPFGATQICLAGRVGEPTSGSGVEASEFDEGSDGTLTIATKYPRFTRQYFHARGVPVEIIKLDGSVELAPVLGLAPYIVDVVETGSTLRAHRLEIKRVIGQTTVKLIANSAYYRYYFREVDQLVSDLRRVLAEKP